MLPRADRQSATCPSCQINPVAVVVDGRRIVAVGRTFSLGWEAPGWASWIGIVEAP